MSMKKKLTVVVTAVTLVALIAIGATLAWFTDSKEVTNVVTMGNIKITLEEPIFSEENENNTITGVLPNQPIDKDPTITNVGNNDAYIRAKINYDGLSAEQAAQVEALLNIDEEAWVKGADGYYYYQEILAARRGAHPALHRADHSELGQRGEGSQLHRGHHRRSGSVRLLHSRWRWRHQRLGRAEPRRLRFRFIG